MCVQNPWLAVGRLFNLNVLYSLQHWQTKGGPCFLFQGFNILHDVPMAYRNADCLDGADNLK